MLCTIDDIKERLGLDTTNTQHDAVLAQIAAGFTALAERYCGRGLVLTESEVTEYHTGQSNLLQVRRYPIASIESVKEAFDFDFSLATALTADTDYRLIDGGRKGVLARLWGDWCKQYDSIQVVYRGGYAAAGATPDEGETAMPEDLREAAILQGAFMFKRRDDLGLSAVSFNGGSISKFSALDLLPLVRQTLDAYRRLSF